MHPPCLLRAPPGTTIRSARRRLGGESALSVREKEKAQGTWGMGSNTRPTVAMGPRKGGPAGGREQSTPHCTPASSHTLRGRPQGATPGLSQP